MIEVFKMNLPVDQVVLLFLVPYCIWVTVSIFNQRQELALFKQALSEFGEEIKRISRNSNSNFRHKQTTQKKK